MLRLRVVRLQLARLRVVCLHKRPHLRKSSLRFSIAKRADVAELVDALV